MFYVFGLLSFVPLTYPTCLGGLALKGFIVLSLKPPIPFLLGSGI